MLEIEFFLISLHHNSKIIKKQSKRMKKTILTALAMFSLSVGNVLAQQPDEGTFSIKPHVGVSLSHMMPRPSYVNDLKPGLTAGVEASYQMSEKLALSLGVNYASMGVKEKEAALVVTEGGVSSILNIRDISQNIHYVQVPLLCNYYVAEGVAIKAGVQMGFTAGKDYTFNVIEAVPGQFSHLDKETYDLDDVKSFDFGIPVGISYEVSNVCLDLRYYFGMTKVFKNTESTRLYDMEKAKNQGITFTVGYKFNLGD